MASRCIPAAPRVHTDDQEARCERMVWLLRATRCVREAPRPRPSRCHPHLPTTLRCSLLGPSHHPALALFLFLSALARSLQASFSISIDTRSCVPLCVYPATVRWLWGVPCLYPAFSRARVFTPCRTIPPPPTYQTSPSHTVCLRSTNHSIASTSLTSALIATATNFEKLTAQTRTFAN